MDRLLVLLIVSAACAAAQSVEGSVFDASTGTGVVGVKVELLRGGTAFYETDTDGGGRFRFDGIKEGDYAVRYRQPNYWLTAGSSDYSLFHVSAANTVKLEARLMPWSKISGRIVDSDGKGIANAPVQLTGSGMLVNGRTYLRTSWGGGGGGALSDSPMRMTQGSKADAKGKFEVQIMPGTYQLSAGRSDTTTVVVLPGVDAPEIELRVREVPTHAVRGVVIDTHGAKATLAIDGHSVETDGDGSFEFPKVPEGERLLLVKSGKLLSFQRIEVPKHDLEGLRLRVTESLTLHAKVVYDIPKDAPLPKEKPGPVMLSRSAEPVPGETILFDYDRDGNLVSLDAHPGTYRLSTLQQPPPPFYLDSALVGGADGMRQDVEITSDTSVTIVYKIDGGSVHGTAEKCFAGGVLLVPADPAMRGRGFSRSGACDSNGHYEIQAVRPGAYYALAFAGNGLVPPIDEALLNQAVTVTVKPGEASSLDLKAATSPIF